MHSFDSINMYDSLESFVKSLQQSPIISEFRHLLNMVGDMDINVVMSEDEPECAVLLYGLVKQLVEDPTLFTRFVTYVEELRDHARSGHKFPLYEDVVNPALRCIKYEGGKYDIYLGPASALVSLRASSSVRPAISLFTNVVVLLEDMMDKKRDDKYMYMLRILPRYYFETDAGDCFLYVPELRRLLSGRDLNSIERELRHIILNVLKNDYDDLRILKTAMNFARVISCAARRALRDREVRSLYDAVIDALYGSYQYGQ